MRLVEVCPLKFVSNLINDTKEIMTRYRSNCEEIRRLELEQNDITHAIGLNKYNAPERIKRYRELKRTIEIRWQLKAENELLEELNNHLKQNSQFLQKLPGIQSRIEKKKEKQEKRTYVPRVRHDLFDEFKDKDPAEILKEITERHNADTRD